MSDDAQSRAKHVQSTREDYSSGGIAYRMVKAAEVDAGELPVEVALIATRGGTRWQLPKGTIEFDESSEDAALREVEEETGLKTEFDIFLQTIDYWYWDTYRKRIPKRVHKRVDFYLLRAVSNTLSDDSREVDSVGWFTIKQAISLLSFAGERRVMEQARELLRTRIG